MDNEKIAAFYDSFLERMKYDHEHANRRHFAIFNHLGKRLKGRIGLTVLDIGCGTGLSSSFMADNFNTRITAVDLSPALIEFAREHSAHENVEYICADAASLDLGMKYDIVVMADCFEHFPRDRIFDLRAVIQAHTHDMSELYINIPYGPFSEFIRRHSPSSMQIIDEVYDPDFIIRFFMDIGLVPSEIEVYGIDTSQPQYMAAWFVNRQYFTREAKTALGLKD